MRKKPTLRESPDFSLDRKKPRKTLWVKSKGAKTAKAQNFHRKDVLHVKWGRCEGQGPTKKSERLAGNDSLNAAERVGRSGLRWSRTWVVKPSGVRDAGRRAVSVIERKANP